MDKTHNARELIPEYWDCACHCLQSSHRMRHASLLVSRTATGILPSPLRVLAETGCQREISVTGFSDLSTSFQCQIFVSKIGSSVHPDEVKK